MLKSHKAVQTESADATSGHQWAHILAGITASLLAFVLFYPCISPTLGSWICIANDWLEVGSAALTLALSRAGLPTQHVQALCNIQARPQLQLADSGHCSLVKSCPRCSWV